MNERRAIGVNKQVAGTPSDRHCNCRHNGVGPEVATEFLLAWNAARCRPPLELEEVVRTVASVAGLHQEGEDSDN